MAIQQQIAHCVWLNMHGKVQNQLVAPWDVQCTNRAAFLTIRKTGIPLKLMLKFYAWWGEHLMSVLSHLNFSILQEH